MSEWKLVPVEPTEAMIEAGWPEIKVRNCWRAMLAAAPQPAVTDEMVERAARAMCKLAHGNEWADTIFEDEPQWKCWEEEARAALTAALEVRDE